MKRHASLALAFAVIFAGAAHAQPSAATAPGINNILVKLFGDNTGFTADLLLSETVVDQTTTMPGKMAASAGRLRIEINLGEAKSPQMRAENIAHLKTMGMDKTVDIFRPDKKIAYFLYPGLSAYAETPLQNADLKPAFALKLKTTEAGKETIDKHPCIKNKVVITDNQGDSYETTTWNATDLKNFPIKIELPRQDQTTTFAFSNVKLGEPAAALFDVPAGYKQYPSRQAIALEQMKKQMPKMAPATNHP